MSKTDEELWRMGYNPQQFNFRPVELVKFQKKYSLDEMAALIEKAKVAFDQYTKENGPVTLCELRFDFETEQIVTRSKPEPYPDRNDFSDLNGVKKPMTVAQLERLFDKFHNTFGKEIIKRSSDDHPDYREWYHKSRSERLDFTREFFSEFDYTPEEFITEYQKIIDVKVSRLAPGKWRLQNANK